MRGRGVIIGATGIGAVGVALLVVESIRALRHVVLGTAGTTLLFVGLGLVVVAAVLAVVSLDPGPAREESAGAVSAADEAPAGNPAEAVGGPAPTRLAPEVVDLATGAAPPIRRNAMATLRGGSSASRPGPATHDDQAAAMPALDLGGEDQVSVQAAAAWTLLCQAAGAGRIESASLPASARRGATLAAFREGVLLDVGKVHRHQSWAQITTITASLGGSGARITVQFTDGVGLADATFTGKNGEFAPVATALVSAAPAGVVAVSYT